MLTKKQQEAIEAIRRQGTATVDPTGSVGIPAYTECSGWVEISPGTADALLNSGLIETYTDEHYNSYYVPTPQ
jgi:hypothetical protein